MLKEKNIPVVLHEEDKAIFGIWREFKGTEDLVLVHKTDMAPKDSRIVTASESGNKYLTNDIEINGKKHEISYKQERYVVNFAVNHEVSQNDGGNWNDCKYIIIVPWNSIPNEQIVGGLSTDIFTDGSVDIKDGYILVPKGEREQVKKDNPELTVIEYDGDRALGYGDAFVEMLGYRYESGGNWEWYNRDSEKAFLEILKKENKVHIADNATGFQKRKIRETFANYCVSAYKYIYDNYDKLFENEYDIFKMEADEFHETNGDEGFEYKNDIIKRLNDLGIKTSPGFSKIIQKIIETDDVSALKLEDLCPDISKYSPENEYYLSKVLQEAKASTRVEKYKFVDKIFRRGIITAIAQSKGTILKDGDFYEPDIEYEEIKDIVIARFRSRKNNTRRI